MSKLELSSKVLLVVSQLSLIVFVSSLTITVVPQKENCLQIIQLLSFVLLCVGLIGLIFVKIKIWLNNQEFVN